MAMTVNTNIQSLNAQRNLSASSAALSTAMTRLSSGLKSNSANDDAAGLAIAGKLDAQAAQVSGANKGVSVAQTAEGALSKISDNLQRMRELVVQSQDGSSADNRAAQQKEFSRLTDEINQIGQETSFGGQKILGKDAGTLQVGAVEVTTQAVNASSLGVAGLSLGGSDTLKSIDGAIEAINSQRAQYGAVQARFESTVANLSVSSENAEAARSRIRDADFSKEAASLFRAQILQQAGNAMIAQANSVPQSVLKLLG